MEIEHPPHVEIYTDGSCKPNPGTGGWAVILKYNSNEKIYSGRIEGTTSNRMELFAAIVALEALKRKCDIDIYVDSDYLRKGITHWIEAWYARQWKTSEGRAVKNIDLWKKLDLLTKQHIVHWHWIKGHSGYPENERVNTLARQALFD